MKMRWILLSVMGLALVGAVTVAVRAGEDEDEQEVSIDQVPAAVKATILKEAEGGRIKEVERETKHGRTIYEAEIIIDGKEVEIKVALDGTLLKKEAEDEEGDDEDEDEDEALPVEQVPAAARDALLELSGKAEIMKFERESEHGVVLYQAEWMTDGRKHEATVTAEGGLIELEEEVPAADVPAAVQRAAAKVFSSGAKLEYEKKTLVVYEVEGKVNGREREVVIMATGKIAGRKRAK